MPEPMLLLTALTAALVCASLGGGFCEFCVVDPYWPTRPGVTQPQRGGISRKLFWTHWTRRSLGRLPLDLIACGAVLAALIAAARLG